MSGDDLRILYDLQGYTKKEREKIGKNITKFVKKFSLKGINVLIDVVCLFDSVRKKSEQKKNYVEIYIKTNFNQVLKRRQKGFYLKN